jgi:GT2 family glycosyltransferase
MARPSDPAAEMRALTEACSRRGLLAQVMTTPRPGVFRVKRRLLGPPLVSIIIPTRGGIDLLRPLLRSIAAMSCGLQIEILLLVAETDPISAEVAALALSHGARIIRYPLHGPFNWSRVNNLGARAARGDCLLFLNDDMQVLSPDWLEALAEHATRPEVAAVGGKLRYQDGTIQHAGIFFCEQLLAGAHSFRHEVDAPRVYHGLLFATRNCSALTGACIMTRKALFTELGGFDEGMQLTCSDSDYCLRALRRGYRVVWTPFAVLEHHEMTTRRGLPEDNDDRRFWDRWADFLRDGDPFYNPNLSQRSEAHVIRDPDEGPAPTSPSPGGRSAPLDELPQVSDPGRDQAAIALGDDVQELAHPLRAARHQ